LFITRARLTVNWPSLYWLMLWDWVGARAAIYDTNIGGTDAGVQAFTREPLERQRFERQATASLRANLST
jgi:hypothetical protein